MTHALKKKRISPLKKETISSFSFRQCPSNHQHHFAVWCFGHRATSWDGASVSPFTKWIKESMEEMFSSLICFYLFFGIFLLGLSLDKALRRPVNVGWNSVTKIWSQISYGNTALPLAPDLKSLQIPHIPTPDTTEGKTR